MFLGQKRSLVRKSLVQKKPKEKWGQTKFWVKEILSSKNLSLKIWQKKMIFVQKDFLSKMYLGQKVLSKSGQYQLRYC